MEDKWLQAAFLGGHPQAARTLLPVSLAFDPELKNEGLPALIEMSAATLQQPNQWMPNGPEFTLPNLLTWLADHPKPSLIRAFASGLKHAGSSVGQADTEHKLTAVFTQAATTAADPQAAESARLEAVQLLGLTSSKDATDALTQCLAQVQPDAVQTAAIRTLAQSSSSVVTKTLISGWAGYGPTAKAAALDALLSREDRALALLESGVVKPAEFSASQVQALLKHKSPKVNVAAKTTLASVIPPSREEVTAKFKPAITAQGDATKGQAQYLARCVACHRAGTMGLQVGPDLNTVKTKGREALLTAILEPHKEVASQFIAYTVTTKDGQTITGIITSDNASSMTLKMMGGMEKTLQRSEVKGSSSSAQSLMPEGLETGMSVTDMADLLSFIEGQ